MIREKKTLLRKSFNKNTLLTHHILTVGMEKIDPLNGQYLTCIIKYKAAVGFEALPTLTYIGSMECQLK